MDYTYQQLTLAAVCNKNLKKIKSGATGSLIFGVLAIYLGLQDIGHSNIIVKFFAGLLLLLGLFLSIEGLIALIKPSPGTYRLEGIGFMLVGAWNIFIGVLSLIGGRPDQIIFVILGIYQIVLGVKTFKEAKEFEKAMAEIPDDSIIKAVDEMGKELLKAKPKDDERYIEFNASSFTKPLQWKGKITDDRLILLSTPDEIIRFLTRNDIDIEKTGKVLIGSTLKIEARVKEMGELPDNTKRDGLVPDLSDHKQPIPGKVEKYKGTMNPDYYQRFENWKNSTPATGDIPGKDEGNGDSGDAVYNVPEDV